MRKIWVNGSFDVLHIGHIRLLEYASTLGELCVGVDTDERIKKMKGDSRPFNSLKDRIEFLSSIKYINSIVSFGSDDELEKLIESYEPDIIVIGDDYEYKPIIGVQFATSVVFFKKVENKSTTKILNYENNSNRRKMS
jgi:D-beta-D-heptose 7-phosphate kinase/D-beta-D-heptose 1-phosphate adenosyltransferase